jgi:tryptophanyl-tRNA synthetase
VYEKRKELETKTDYIIETLHEGERRARKVAIETMSQVREAMKIG